jgi:PAS domain S-box-containing protein
MKRPSEPGDPEELRAKIIGFGERSSRKTFYPELRLREERLRAVFEGAAIGIGVIDPEGHLQDTNRELQEMLGRSGADLHDRPYHSFVHPDDRDRFCERHAELLRGATDRVAFEVRLSRPDGETIWAQVRASLVKEDGAPAYIVAAAQDVTLRKRARQALEFLSRASVLLATSLDVGGTLRNLAELAVPFLGDLVAISVRASDGGREHRLVACADPAQQPLAEELFAGQSLAEAFGAPSGPPRLLQDASATLLLAEADPARRERLRRLDLRSLLAIPLPSDGSRGTLLLATAASGRRYGTFDLELATEFAQRAALALQNASLLLRVQEASRLKDEFLAVVSHELRTPLTSILGWMHLIRTKDLDPADAQRGLSVVERNAQTLAQIIYDLLGASHMLAGKLEVHPALMDLAPVIEDAVEALAPSAHANRVAVHVECESGLPPVLGDAKQLQQVVWNLVSNAVKYTPEGGEVRVRLARAGGSAELTVRDTGRGISPEFLPHVFEPFRQEDGSATRCYGGLGLGLAIVRHLVELHGGAIRATSGGERRGACFTVTLPLAPGEAAVARPPVPAELRRVQGAVLAR